MTTGMVEQMIAVAVAGLLEGIGVPWPGAIVVAGAGIVAGGGWQDVLLLTAAFGFSYCLGALMQYAVGRFLGTRALAWIPAKYRQRIDTMMTRYGSAAVLFSRPLAIGNYVSAPAGIMRMPLRRFLPTTFLGICPWALGMLIAGDAMAVMLGGAQEAIHQYWLPAAALLGAAMLVRPVWKWLRSAPAPMHGD